MGNGSVNIELFFTKGKERKSDLPGSSNITLEGEMGRKRSVCIEKSASRAPVNLSIRRQTEAGQNLIAAGTPGKSGGSEFSDRIDRFSLLQRETVDSTSFAIAPSW